MFPLNSGCVEALGLAQLRVNVAGGVRDVSTSLEEKAGEGGYLHNETAVLSVSRRLHQPQGQLAR